MASVYKRTYTASINGRKVRRKCQHYTIRFKDLNGQTYTTRGFSDRAESVKLCGYLVKLARFHSTGEPLDEELTVWLKRQPEKIRAEIERLGLIDSPSGLRRKPLTAHLEEYLCDLEARGRDEKYCYVAERRLRKLATECKWVTVADMSADSFIQWRSMQGDLAGKTLNEYLNAANAFLNWCRKQGRIGANPLSQVGKVDTRGKVKRKRRALTADETDRLLARAGTRRLLYRTTFYCQLRRADVETLRWADVGLDTVPPYLITRAETAKGKRETKHPLRESLAAELRAFKPATAKATDLVFPDVPSVPEFRRDLERAEIEFEDELGQRADFHAFGRKTPNTIMANVGVPPRIAQELMRHTDIRLTTQVYTDPALLQKLEAIESLPELGLQPAAGSAGHPLNRSLNLKTDGPVVTPDDRVAEQHVDSVAHEENANPCLNKTLAGSDEGMEKADEREILQEGRTPRVGLEPILDRIFGATNAVFLRLKDTLNGRSVAIAR